MTDPHPALTFVPELGHATTCSAYRTHHPRPLRFVWHHVLPQTCGGSTVASNLVSLCDNCHYSVHALLWQLARGQTLSRLGTVGQRLLARRGYAAAVTAGTVAQIPNEGSVVTSS